MTLRDLSKATGMSESQLSQIETGFRKDPAFGTIAKVARALEISLDALAGFQRAASLPALPAKSIAELERARADALKSAARIESIIEAIKNP
jgi:transcriptional regulator with XRE-family HTH domain